MQKCLNLYVRFLKTLEMETKSETCILLTNIFLINPNWHILSPSPNKKWRFFAMCDRSFSQYFRFMIMTRFVCNSCNSDTTFLYLHYVNFTNKFDFREEIKGQEPSPSTLSRGTQTFLPFWTCVKITARKNNAPVTFFMPYGFPTFS